MKDPIPWGRLQKKVLEAVFCALGTGLGIGILDLSAGIAFKGYPFFQFSIEKYSPPSLSSALMTVIAASATIAVSYFVLWLLVVTFFQARIRVRAVQVALAAFFFSLWLFSASQIILSPATLMFDVGPAAVTALAVYALSSEIHSQKLIQYVLFLPAALGQLFIIAWVDAYLPPLSTAVFLLSRAGLFAGLLVTYLLAGQVRRMGVAALLQAALFFAVLLGAQPDQPSASGSPATDRDVNSDVKRIILITVDTLRADALSLYGGSTETPQLDLLAEEGWVYQNAISPAPWTLPAMASILTGLSPAVHQVVTEETQLSERLPTLAEQFSEAGYLTAAIVSNPYLAAHSNFTQGFEEYYYLSPEESWLTPVSTLGSMLLEWASYYEIPYLASEKSFSTAEVTDFAQQWIEQNQEQDFFLWLHYFDPHTPYSPPEDFLAERQPPEGMTMEFDDQYQVNSGLLTLDAEQREWVRELYDAEVRYVDQNLGRLFNRLRRLNLYDETLIVVTSDHGEEFWEHGRTYHAHTLYNELLQVPLIIKPPLSTGREPASIASLVTTQSIFSTLQEICDLSRPTERFVTPALPLASSEPSRERVVYSSALLFSDVQEAVITDDYKYIRSRITEREELYDLKQDPEEQHSLGASYSEKKWELSESLEQVRVRSENIRASMGLTGQKGKPSPEAIRRLKALGYIQ